MAIDTVSPRSRRAILAASLGGLFATVATALGRPSPAQADNGQAILLGTSPSGTLDGTGTNEASATTAIYAHSGDGLSAHSAGGVGLFGITGTGFAAVAGNCTSSLGGHGVSGNTFSASGAGVRGTNVGYGTGVYGRGGQGPDPALPAYTGVFGYAVDNSVSRGVHGRSTSGRGVYGQATSGSGVRGYATSGAALYGAANTGYALRTSGRLRFEKSAGVATIASGTKSKSVTPGIDLTAASAVVATLQGSAGGTTTVHRVVVDTAANTFRVYLTAKATQNVKVAWLVFG